MFANFKQIFSSKNRDLQKKILLTFGVLFIFKLGTAIIVPGIDKNALNVDNLGFLELINAMGGGALKQFSIFGLGVMPYITASIIMQLLQMDIVPYFSDLAKEGQTGRVKLNKITRIMGIVIAFIQGYLLSLAFVKNGDPITYMQIAVVLTAGTAFLLWLGDQITSKGIGNGISLIIMAGIISSLPTMFTQAFNILMNDRTMALGISMFVGFVLLYLLILVGVVFIESAERRIPIQYANKSTGSLGKQNYIPFKLNSAGVTPVIFASALIAIPGMIAGFVKNAEFTKFINTYLTMNSISGFLIYIIFIFVFAYIYTFMQIKPKEMAEDLQKNGGYIPGIRPGVETNKYVTSVLTKITLVGAFALAVIAGMPIVFSLISGFPQSISVGGTGLIIVVGVALETYKQLDSQLASRVYTENKGRRRRRS